MESFKEKGQLLVLGHYMHAIFQRDRATISIIGIGKDKSILDGKNKVEQFIINKCFFFYFPYDKVWFTRCLRSRLFLFKKKDELCFSDSPR